MFGSKVKNGEPITDASKLQAGARISYLGNAATIERVQHEHCKLEFDLDGSGHKIGTDGWYAFTTLMNHKKINLL